MPEDEISWNCSGPQLNFGKHVAYIQSKVIPKIKTLSKIAPIIKCSTFLMIYKTLILPIIEYGDIIYDCLSVKDAATHQKLQNACLKHILRLPRLNSTTYIHETLDIQYLSDRRKQHTATQMFRIDNGMAPQYLLDQFTDRSEVSTITTRISAKGNYQIPKVRLEMSKRNFICHGTKIWYEVPCEVKCATNLKTFGKEIAQVWKRDGDYGVT